MSDLMVKVVNFLSFFAKLVFHCLSNMAAKRPLKFQDAVMKHYRVKGKISILEHYISNQNSIFNSVKFEFFGFAHANFFNVFFFNMRSLNLKFYFKFEISVKFQV